MTFHQVSWSSPVATEPTLLRTWQVPREDHIHQQSVLSCCLVPVELMSHCC